MKILFTIEFYEPNVGGATRVTKQIAERLAADGHTVAVAAAHTNGYPYTAAVRGVKIFEFDIWGNNMKGIKGKNGEIARYQDLLRGDFDIIVNYAAQAWPTDLAFPVLDEIKAKKILIPCGYPGLHNPRYAGYYQKLPAYLKKYDALVYMSLHYQDKAFGDEHGVGNKAVLIPNGASEEEFPGVFDRALREKLGIKTSRLLICVTNHHVLKGHHFVWEAFRKMKRKDTSLLFVGTVERPTSLRGFAHWLLDYAPCRVRKAFNKRTFMIDGRDRAVALAAYKAADAFLFGSDVECAPLVMYESFAAGVPFITTPVGNVEDHMEALRIARTPEEMARHANELLDDETARRDLAARAQKLWREHHRSGELIKTYESLFRKLAR